PRRPCITLDTMALFETIDARIFGSASLLPRFISASRRVTSPEDSCIDRLEESHCISSVIHGLRGGPVSAGLARSEQIRRDSPYRLLPLRPAPHRVERAVFFSGGALSDTQNQASGKYAENEDLLRKLGYEPCADE